MVAEAKAAPGQESQFVAPTPGVTPRQRWLQKCALAPDHVAAGDFTSAMRLLNRYAKVLFPLCCSPCAVPGSVERVTLSRQNLKTLHHIITSCDQVHVLPQQAFEMLVLTFEEQSLGCLSDYLQHNSAA